jgi:TetR/AcrR family transcriptional regulator, repressor for neighboring sulfatase
MAAAKQAGKSKRQRRSPATVRSATLHAARTILFRDGPEGITMPAVAKELGMSHGNLTHHFGSIGALHAALVDQMAQELANAVHNAVTRMRDDQTDQGAVVDAVFGAFSDGGAGHLISWLASTDNMDALEPLFTTVAKAVRDLSRDAPNGNRGRSTLVRQNALSLLSTALGNALIGERLHSALGLAPGSLNKLSAKELVNRARARKA